MGENKYVFLDFEMCVQMKGINRTIKFNVEHNENMSKYI